MSRSTFPEELIERIIICAYDGIASSTLKASSLVCRRWNAISRPFIFRRVTISSGASLESLLAFLSTDRDVISLIRVLVIRARRADDILKPSAWVGRVPLRLPAFLRYLETIELHYLYESGEAISAQFIEGFSHFTSVHRLTFHECSLPIVLVQALVAALPALQQLTIFHLSPHDLRTATPPPFLHSPRLISIEMRFAHSNFNAMNVFLPWLAESDTRHTLRSLTATVRTHGAEAFGHFLAAVGPQIDTLRLELSTYYGLSGETTSVKARFHIGHCTNLRELDVCDEDPVSPAVCACIAEVRSPSFRTIVIPLFMGRASIANIPSLARLDPVLCACALGGLGAVYVKYCGTLDMRDVREKVHKELPATHARGVLHVACGLV